MNQQKIDELVEIESLVKEMSRLLLKEEETDEGRLFRPNRLEINSCRCLEGPEIYKIGKKLGFFPNE